MSGVLDRMLQRSRGHLPAVEPLVAPQKTPGAVLHARQEEVVKPIAAERTLTPRERQVQGKESQAEERNEQRIRDAAKAGTNPEEASESIPESRTFQRVAPESQGTSPVPHSAMGATPLATTDRALEASQQSVEHPARVAEAGATPVPSTGNQARTSERAETRSQNSKSIDLEAKPAVADHGEIEVKAAVVRHERAERRAEKPPAQAPAPLVETGEHTEIHISIGSVELRSPRAEVKAPTFRPRVTLDEFLRRKAGEES